MFKRVSAISKKVWIFGKQKKFLSYKKRGLCASTVRNLCSIRNHNPQSSVGAVYSDPSFSEDVASARLEMVRDWLLQICRSYGAWKIMGPDAINMALRWCGDRGNSSLRRNTEWVGILGGFVSMKNIDFKLERELNFRIGGEHSTGKLSWVIWFGRRIRSGGRAIGRLLMFIRKLAAFTDRIRWRRLRTPWIFSPALFEEARMTA
jgi:hypothetical protein